MPEPTGGFHDNLFQLIALSLICAVILSFFDLSPITGVSIPEGTATSQEPDIKSTDVPETYPCYLPLIRQN